MHIYSEGKKRKSNYRARNRISFDPLSGSLLALVQAGPRAFAFAFFFFFPLHWIRSGAKEKQEKEKERKQLFSFSLFSFFPSNNQTFIFRPLSVEQTLQRQDPLLKKIIWQIYSLQRLAFSFSWKAPNISEGFISWVTKINYMGRKKGWTRSTQGKTVNPI